jgi:hypothetical protein
MVMTCSSQSSAPLRMLEKIEAELPTAQPATQCRLRTRAELIRGLLTPETNKPPIDLAAYRARLSDPSGPRANLSLRPVCISVRTHRQVRLEVAFGRLRRFAFPAQFLNAGAYDREIVSSTRSVHVSSHPLGRVLVALYAPRAGAKRS